MDNNMAFALFKFQIIAPVLNDRELNQKKYFKKMAGQKYLNPNFTKQEKFSPSTFKKWLFLYKKYGLSGLQGGVRKDKGESRSIGDELKQTVSNLVGEYKFRTVTNLYEYLIANNIISEHEFTYATLNNYIKQNNIFNPDIQKKERKAYEVEHINNLWVTDFMYGPYVFVGKSKVRTYLCAIIDDYSRVIVAAAFYETQSTLALELTLKNAIATFGIPNKLYSDNGKVFSGGYLDIISARIGFIMVHSKPHDAASRGKIERFFRTVRDRFIPGFHIRNKDQRLTLELLNSDFSSWLFADYNNKIHSTINSTPLSRYFADNENVKIRKVAKQDINTIFYHTMYRTVNNDSTISNNRVIYEVPAKYIGKKIEIRFSPECQNELFLYENDKQILQLKILNRHENSKFPIRFNKEEFNNV